MGESEFAERQQVEEGAAELVVVGEPLVVRESAFFLWWGLPLMEVGVREGQGERVGWLEAMEELQETMDSLDTVCHRLLCTAVQTSQDLHLEKSAYAHAPGGS